MEHKAKKKKVKGYFRGTEVGLMIETFQSDFKIFGEALDDVKRNLKDVKKTADATFDEVGNIKVEITDIKVRLEAIEARLDAIEERLDILEKEPAVTKDEVESLKRESQDIRKCSDGRDVHERLNVFEARIKKIEQHLKISAA